MSESHVPSRSSPGPNESSNASFSSLTSINSSKNCAEIKSEVFAGVHSDIVESPEIGSEDSLERSPSVKQLSQMFVEESIGEGTTPSSPVEVSVRRVSY